MSNNPASQKITCQHCKKKFIPDPRNAYHQKYCSRSDCRYASKRNSYQQWRAKNPDWFRGHDNVLRVQIWRRVNGKGCGKLIFKMVLDLLIYKGPKGKEQLKVRKRDRNGRLLQDFYELKNTITTRVILKLAHVLQVLIAQMLSAPYSFPQKGKRASNGGKENAKLQRTLARPV